MSLNQILLPEYDQEMATTRRLLERVPEDRFDWQPHTKSMTLGRLANHLAELPGLARMILGGESFNIASGQFKPAALTSRQEVLDLFDQNVASTRAALAETGDEAMKQKWSLLRGEDTVFSVPRAAAIRSMVLSHTIHHRAQLSVYLRLNDVPVPSIYGPSADEM